MHNGGVVFNFFKRKGAGEQPPSTATAVALFQRGDFEGALREADALIKHVPGVAMSHRFRGEVLFSLERFDDSISAFQTAETLGGPGTEEAFFWRALAHANSGRASQAIAILENYHASPSANSDLVQKCNAAIQAIKSQSGQA